MCVMIDLVPVCSDSSRVYCACTARNRGDMCWDVFGPSGVCCKKIRQGGKAFCHSLSGSRGRHFRTLKIFAVFSSRNLPKNSLRRTPLTLMHLCSLCVLCFSLCFCTPSILMRLCSMYVDVFLCISKQHFHRLCRLIVPATVHVSRLHKAAFPCPVECSTPFPRLSLTHAIFSRH